MADVDTPDQYDENELEDEQSDVDDTRNEDTTMLDDEDGDRQHERMSNGRAYVVSEENTDYSVFTNPPSLGLIRQRLFDVDEPLELSPSDFETYFPFIDNVWRKYRAGDAQKERGQTTEWYWCRLRKATNAKVHAPKPTPEGKQSRRRRAREERTCPMALKVVWTDGPVKKCTIVKGLEKEARHTHDMDYMDSLKRNSGVMDIARRESNRGFLPGSVFWKMQQEPDRMDEAGGKFMKVSDVRNVQYAWRQANPDFVLRAHTGYSMRTGPRQKFALATPTTPQPQSQPQVQAQPQADHAPPPPRQTLPVGTLQYPQHARDFLQDYLPDVKAVKQRNRPHITLTWASGLDSRIAMMPGVQTAISGPETKAMTHYLRSKHDAIVIGVRTAMSDNPGLNCRLQGAGGYGGVGWEQQPRPIIIDPNARLIIRPEMKMLQLVKEGRAKAPWIVVGPQAMLHPTAVSILKGLGGEYLMINDYHPQRGGLKWEGLFNVFFKEGIRSIMVEGGGIVLSELLRVDYSHLIDSIILTIAPTFFGRTGVEVSPIPTMDSQNRPIATRLTDVRWQPMGDADVVMCGHMKIEAPAPNGILPGIEEFSRAAVPETQEQADKASENPEGGEQQLRAETSGASSS